MTAAGAIRSNLWYDTEKDVRLENFLFRRTVRLEEALQ